MAPGLTVRNRLQVLIPDQDGNYYDAFNIVPLGEREKLRQGKVLIRNWHALNWESDEQLAKKKTVDKRGAKSDEAYVRESILSPMAKVVAGYEPVMPTFQGLVTEDQVLQLVEYIKSIGPRPGTR